MKKDEIEKNPEVDYTKYARFLSYSVVIVLKQVNQFRPELISLVFSDVGILTPGGVSQYLVGMFAG